MVRERRVRLRLSLSPEEVDTLWVVLRNQWADWDALLRNSDYPDDRLAGIVRERNKVDALIKKLNALPRGTVSPKEE